MKMMKVIKFYWPLMLILLVLSAMQDRADRRYLCVFLAGAGGAFKHSLLVNDGKMGSPDLLIGYRNSFTLFGKDFLCCHCDH